MSRVPSRYSSENIFHKNITIYENDNNDSIILNASNITDGGYMLTFPENQGDVDQVLSTNGSGILSWVDQTSGLEENVSVSGTLSVSGTTTLNSDTTINANLNILEDLNVSGTSTIDGISTFNNNVTINGSLTVNGSSTYVYSENLVIKDPLIKLADNNASDNVDIGFYGEYDNNKYSGLIRNPNDEEWYLFKDSTDDPPNMSNLEQANLNSNLDGGVVIKVIAKTTLTKGHAVYIHSDTDNDNTYVDKAIANDTSKMPSFGLILKDTNASSTGYVITLGNIINVNASDVVETGITLNNGDICYISASETGKITNIPPSGESNRIQNIGIVIRKNNNNVSLRVGGAGRTNACPSLNHNNIFIGDSNNNVSTISFNNALSNSNAVLTSGDQTIDGTKTFNNTISASITGNAGTATNGIYTTSSVTDLSDISSSGSGQIITSAERTKLTNFYASDINGSITNNQLVNSSMTIDGTSVSLGGTINTSNTTYSNGSGITLTGTTFSANVDDSSIEYDTNGKISIKNSGVTNDMLTGSISNDKLAGSIANNQLVNSSMTIDGISVSLGDTINTSNTTYSSGSGITLTGTTFSANVDDTSIKHDTNGKISIKDSGVTNDMLANNSITINGSSVSLGNSITTPDTNTTYSSGSGITLTGTTFSANVSDFMTNGSNNRILTATGTDGMNAEDKLTFDGSTLSITGNIIPSVNVKYDLGSSTKKFRDLYLSGATIHLGDTDLKSENNSLKILHNGSTTLQKIRIDELEIGDDDNKVVLKKGSNNRLEIKTRDNNNNDTNNKIHFNDLDGSVTNSMLAGSISNDKLAGSISNNKLANNSITINGSSVALGSSITTPNTQLSDIQVQNIVGGMFTGNTETGISATYQDTDGTIDLVIGTNSITNGMLAGSIPVSKGGTGQTTFTSNGILTGNGTDAIQSESKLTFDGSSLSLITDSSKIKFGSNTEITLTHDYDTGLTLTNTISETDNRPVVFKLKSEEDTINADDVIGALEFVAGDYSGIDAATNCAGIYAVAENTFTISANPTKLVFTTGVSEDASIITNASATSKMILTSDGNLVVSGHVFGSGSITYHKVLNRSLSILYLGSTFKEIHSDLRIKVVVNKSIVTLGFYSGAFNANNKFIRYEIFDWSNTNSHTGTKAFMQGGTSRKAINIHHTLTDLTPGNTYYFAWRFRSDSNYAYIYPSNIYSHPEVFVIEHESGLETSYGSLLNHTYPSV